MLDEATSEHLNAELGAVGIQGGLRAQCVTVSRDKALKAGLTEAQWIEGLLTDLVLWRAKKKKVRFVDFALTFEDVS